MGSEDEFYTIENSTSKEVICTFQDDTSGPLLPVQFSVNNTHLEDIVVETISEDDDTVTSVKNDVTTASFGSAVQFCASGDHSGDQFCTSGDQFDNLSLCASEKCQFENSENFENFKLDDTSMWKSNDDDPGFSHASTTGTTHPPDTHVQPTSGRT